MLYKPIYLAIALISLALFNQVAMCYFAHGNSTTTIYDAATTTATVFVDPLGSPVKQPTSTFASSATSTTTSTTTAHTKPQPFLAACRVKVLVFLNNFIAFGLYYFLVFTIELVRFLNYYIDAVATTYSFGWWTHQLIAGMLAKYFIKFVLWAVWPRGMELI